MGYIYVIRMFLIPIMLTYNIFHVFLLLYYCVGIGWWCKCIVTENSDYVLISTEYRVTNYYKNGPLSYDQKTVYNTHILPIRWISGIMFSAFAEVASDFIDTSIISFLFLRALSKLIALQFLFHW